MPGWVEGGHGGLHGVAGRKQLTGAGYRGRGIPAWDADKPGGGILPLEHISDVADHHTIGTGRRAPASVGLGQHGTPPAAWREHPGPEPEPGPWVEPGRRAETAI